MMRLIKSTPERLTMGPFLQPLSPMDRHVVARFQLVAERKGYTVTVHEDDRIVTITATRGEG